MEFCAGFFKFFFQFSNALLISTKYLTIYFVRFLIYHNHEHQSRTHILVRDFDDSCANSLLAAILYQLLQIISGNHFVFPPQFLNSTSRCAFDDPDIPLILAHRQAALAFCRNPGIGHIQFPLRRYSGKRHRCRFPCSLLFSCIPLPAATYRCSGLVGLSGIVINNCPLASIGFKNLSVKCFMLL
jgi:hypothetical protein